MNPKHYSMAIQWDTRDNIYVVTVPERGCRTHGETYNEAIKNALEVLSYRLPMHNMQENPSHNQWSPHKS